jgi:uncharacterized heparinase superfamily protein
MSADEIVARFTRYVGHRRDDLEWRVARRRWERRWQNPPVERQQRARPLGFLTNDRARELLTSDPVRANRLVARADEILGGFAFPFGKRIGVADLDTFVDPVTRYRWPSSHAKTIDYRSAPANPKWIWELNRCQELPILIAASLVSQESTYADRAESILVRWISDHPPGRGIAWANGFEAGLRAISLALTIDSLMTSSNLSDARRELFIGSLWQHARWIERDPSTHSSANNHRIGELVGLLFVALLAPELPESPRWASDALAELSGHARRQIRRDGTGIEQSYAYTLLVLDLLLLSAALLEARELEIPSEIRMALDRASHGLWAQLGPGEPEPTYGDNDDGHAVRLDGEDSRRGRNVAAALCACLGSQYARAVADSLDPMSIWLFGRTGRERFDTATSAKAPPSFVLADAGLAILRSDQTRVTLDAGALGYLPLAAHGHADALALTVSSRGRDVITDPGTGTYFAGDAHVRNAFRGTGFHATVVVDGQDQSVSGGPFLWTRHARSRLSRADLAAGFLSAEHDGYTRLADPVRHRRMVLLLDPHCVLVVDCLEAEATHCASVRWPIRYGMQAHVDPSRGCVRVEEQDAPILTLGVAASVPGAWAVAYGDAEPFAGWESPRLEELVPAPLVAWDAVFERELYAATLLVLHPKHAQPDMKIRRVGSSLAIALSRESDELVVRIDLDDLTIVATSA